MASAPPDAGKVRAAIRAGRIGGPTQRLAPDRVQANLVVVERELAADLRDLCARNPVPCPLIEVLAPGEFEPRCARGGDLRTDLGRYRVWRDGEHVATAPHVVELWSEELVAFLIGSILFRFTVYSALRRCSPRRPRLKQCSSGPMARRAH